MVKIFDQKNIELRGGKYKNPRVFTEQGVAMLATILKARNADAAIEITIANNVATLTRNGESLFSAKTQKTISTNLINL